MDKKKSLTGIDTQVKPSICCCTSIFYVGSYLRRVATNVVVLSVSIRRSITYHINLLYCFKYFLETCLKYIYQMDTVKNAVIRLVKVIHSGQNSNVNILCMRYNLKGLKLVHANISTYQTICRENIYEPKSNYVFQSVCLFMLRARSISPKRLEAYQRNVQNSHFSGWLVILV